MMFEPNEDEARRGEALSQAVMSFESTAQVVSGDQATQAIIKRAESFEAFLKGGLEEVVNHENDSRQPIPRPGPSTAFGAYQDRGLDSGSS